MDVRRRSGYTLLEVVVAMAIAVIVSAASVSPVQSLIRSFKVHGSVDAVRAAWAQARARAIDEGRSYRFAIIPDTGHYRIAPDEPTYWSGAGGSQDGQPGLVVQDSLPTGVVFNVNGSNAQGGAGGDSLGDPAPATEGSDAYSYGITFQLDGTATTDAEVIFRMPNAPTMSLCLRGMTGAVTAKSLTGGR